MESHGDGIFLAARGELLYHGVLQTIWTLTGFDGTAGSELGLVEGGICSEGSVSTSRSSRWCWTGH
jgi:hypothetical protein